MKKILVVTLILIIFRILLLVFATILSADGIINTKSNTAVSNIPTGYSLVSEFKHRKGGLL